ncbi:hypothetical protein ABH926_001831 [Catenulispora sp. GP43]|uniref:hypothetical protein n=1 Tax=Catenulispora sp. GP43 TaxID=3156263 RepID=UPI003513E20D
MGRIPARSDPDARAAARIGGFVDQAGSPAPTAPGFNQVGLCTTEVWAALAEAVFRARSVDIIGIAPRGLLEALRELAEPTESAVLPPLRYYTPVAEIMLASRDQRSRTRLVNRWQVGLMGLRNLIRALEKPTDPASGQPAGSHSFVSGLSELFVDCAVVLNAGAADEDTLFLAELPPVPGFTTPPTLCSRMTGDSPDLARYVGTLKSSAGPLRQREVNCQPLESETSVGEPTAHRDAPSDGTSVGSDGIPTLTISALTPYGSSSSAAPNLKPVAVVVVRCLSPHGTDLVLKIRTPFTDNDDFGKLSLLSCRVQETDIATAIQANVSPAAEDDETAFEDLWLAAGSPDPFILPTAAYAEAANRELFMTLGLEVAPERLVLRGFQCVDHENGNGQLGFAVFTVDLIRGPRVDELRQVLQRNPEGLVRVPLHELYDPRRELNRLLRRRRSWLSEHCFSVATPVAGSPKKEAP